MDFGWFAFHEEQRHPIRGRSHMKPADIESSTGLDRLATSDEVRCAMLFSSQGASELVGSCDDLLGVDSDFNARAYNLPDDIMWLNILGEMADFTSN
jgi:hypothetical protein